MGLDDNMWHKSARFSLRHISLRHISLRNRHQLAPIAVMPTLSHRLLRLTGSLLFTPILFGMASTLITGCEPTVSRDNPWDEGSSTYVDADNDSFPAAGDCDDTNAEIAPNLPELCNGIDDNCDEEIDEGLPRVTYYPDEDGDQVGGATRVERCAPLEGEVTVGGDCDDTDPTINPDAEEICDGEDQNCNGDEDEGLDFIEWFVDDDGDEFGDPDTGEEACEQPRDTVDNGDDCDDSDPDINPDAAEVCNGEDENCNNTSDEGLSKGTFYDDLDLDSFGNPASAHQSCGLEGEVSVAGDCNDDDDTVNPSAPEVCDGADNDCDTLIDEGISPPVYYRDLDEDGYGNTKDSISECTPPTGYVTNGLDCDDENALINPEGTEICNGLDDDCNERVDDGIATITSYRDADSDGYGDPTVTIEECAVPDGYVSDSSDCNDADATIHPDASEALNATDDDCNGATDDHVRLPQSGGTVYANEGGLPALSAQWISSAVGDPPTHILGALGTEAGPRGVALWDLDTTKSDQPILHFQQDVEGAGVAYTSANLDSDGRTDVVIATYDIDSDASFLTYYPGAGIFSGLDPLELGIEFRSSALNGKVTAIAAVDMDGDGADEVLVSCPTCNDVEDSSDNPGILLLLRRELTGGLTEFARVVPGTDFDSFGGALAVVTSGPSTHVVTPSTIRTSRQLLRMTLTSSLEGENMASDLVIAIFQDDDPSVRDLTPISLGDSVAFTSDVTGDGLMDLLATGQTAEGTGIVYVIPSVLALEKEVDLFSFSFFWTGIQDRLNIGNHVAAAGDLDGDGVSDFLLGGTLTPADGTQLQTLYIVKGQDFTSGLSLADASLATLEVEETVLFGTLSAYTGDPIADGYSELLLAVPGYESELKSGYLSVLPNPYE